MSDEPREPRQPVEVFVTARTRTGELGSLKFLVNEGGHVQPWSFELDDDREPEPIP